MADFSSPTFWSAVVVIFCGAVVEASLAVFCTGMCCGALKESSSATNDSLMVVESSSAIFRGPPAFCGAMADSFSTVFYNGLVDSSLTTNGSMTAESSLAIFCDTMANSTFFRDAGGDSSLPTSDGWKAETFSSIFCSAMEESSLHCPIAESSSLLIKEIKVADSSLPINDKVCRLVGGEKISNSVCGATNVSLWRMKNIWASVFGWATAIWGIFVQLGHRMLNLIILCLASVLYLGPAATNFIYKAFVILREISRASAEINRCFAEITRSFAEIKKGVAVLKRIMLRTRLRKFLLAFFLVCICILYASSPTHIHQVSTQPQMISISKDLIVNVTASVRDNEGLVVRREFTFHVAIFYRCG